MKDNVIEKFKWIPFSDFPKTTERFLYVVISTMPCVYANEYEVALWDNDKKVFFTPNWSYDPRELKFSNYYYMIYNPAPNHLFEIG